MKNDPIRSAALGLIAPISFYINGVLLNRCSVLIIFVFSLLKKTRIIFYYPIKNPASYEATPLLKPHFSEEQEVVLQKG
ncbi:hypothetical protein BA171_05620 [Candidatus Hamiltonella defensa (Bemisia tabaci)]|uniref:Uncharacterized protein n=1 Tax=Candidatus Hamiltonella defensa (Bemisia tabaci) TaxID=672795 RepID=A0A249DYB9_9ENTR|nr:hypothetical protein BA171_05620 [Candidatus Hamiltonella defensa (Bemisia tabaci)]